MNTHPLTPHVYKEEDWLYTINLVPGITVYTEKLYQIDNTEYRSWNPYKSKLAAAILNGLQTFPFSNKSTVLYLGAASGTTASHISDICREGLVFCVEFSPRTARELVYTCEKRENMIPLLKDASKPETYSDLVSTVDIIYQDIAQPNQSEILKRNFVFLKKGGYSFICIKSRSIDVTQEPQSIFKKEAKVLKTFSEVCERIPLEPYEKDHLMIVGKKV
ncbi:MAG: fibrillarin-like rRNA/tRNA 2'-O-methyltransferase [Theionarchaea archaeon]|nr:fibrillarin-like rRNA/tRNA 2'-O-methyltransferase [Theionarchaea archaeon]